MAQSPEFPQYRWMPPRSWTNASRAYPDDIRWIVIHTTEGSEGPSSAEDGAAYDQRRTDGTSAHFYVDSNSIVQCVRTSDIAHTARASGNRHGIHIEVCGRAGQTDAQWNDAVSRATIEKVAELCRVLRRKYPVPIVNLTAAQVKAGSRGFCEHKDISQAFGESDHWDPGPRFPWARMFDLIKGSTTEEDGMSVADVTTGLTTVVPYASNAGKRLEAEGWANVSARTMMEYVWETVRATNKAVAALTAQLVAKDNVDEVALANALAPAVAAAVVAALPPDRDDIATEELTEAVRTVVREAFTPAGSEEAPVPPGPVV